MAVGKAFGAIAIDIHAGELFAVMVIHRDLPMAVLTAAVAAEPAGTGLLWFRLFHVAIALNARDYGNFGAGAQVTSWGLTFLLFGNYERPRT